MRTSNWSPSILVQILVFSLFILMLVWVSACGRTVKDSRSQAPAGEAILASLAGIDPNDAELEGMSFWLICQDQDELQGERLGEALVRFDGQHVSDGSLCALEVRAEPKPGIIWLSSPQKVGLYYGSDRAEVKSRKLEVKLYKVYTRPDNSTELHVHSLNAGLCERYLVEERRCAPVDDDEDKTSGNDRLLTILGIKVEPADGTSVRIADIESNRLAQQAGILTGDIVLLANGEKPQDSDNLANIVEAAYESGQLELWFSIVRDSESHLITF